MKEKEQKNIMKRVGNSFKVLLSDTLYFEIRWAQLIRCPPFFSNRICESEKCSRALACNF